VGERKNLPVELQPNENLLLLARRHWLNLYPRLLLIALIGIVPIVLLIWIVDATAGMEGTTQTVVLIVCALWALFWLVRGYFTWYRYNNDIWLITDQRLIDSLKKHWFHHQMASTDLVDVEDVAVQRSGILQTTFNYGDLRCQTAGAQANFILAGIPDPNHVLQVLDAARDASRRELRGV
jgi:hypothetical protein